MENTPAYVVRVSTRCRSVRLSMSLYDGLEVVVPRGFNPARIPQVLQRHQRWIDRHHRRMEKIRPLCGPRPNGELPTQILLPAIGESWAVTYQTVPSSRIRVRESGPGELTVLGPAHFRLRIRRALVRWLSARCRVSLVTRLRQVSRDYRLPFQAATIRLQKSRWASCSRRGTVSLNLRLLFLPPHLVHHVFLHELSHTVHLNHSRQFWDFLGQIAPHYQEHRARLKTAWTLVPPWVA